MYFLGVDPSLNGTGLHVIDEKLRSIDYVHVKMPAKLRSGSNGGQRLKLIHSMTRDIIAEYTPVLSCIEQGAFSATSQHHSLGKAIGVCELALALEEREYIFIEPTRMKKMVTGNGRASKAVVSAYMYLNSGLVEGDTPLPDDISDAFALASVARFIWRAAHTPGAALSLYETSVVNSVVWSR